MSAATNLTPDAPALPGPANQSISTLSVHADDKLNDLPPSLSQRVQDVAPALHVSTTYRFASNPDDLVEAKDADLYAMDGHVYSRETAPNTTRLESILSSVTGGRALCYSSGLSAIFAAYTLLKPGRVSIGGGYHGSHGVLAIHSRLTGLKTLPLDCPAEDLQPGDVIHIETPINPTGTVYDMSYYAEKAHSRGAYLLVDSTFAPPGLQDPFAHGADLVMHSGTKYFGGHSDLLCGVLVVKNEEWWKGLFDDRTNIGFVMGNMESWLTVRSMRTFELRLSRQSENTTKIVDWFYDCLHSKSSPYSQDFESDSSLVKLLVDDILHSSIQAKDPANSWIAKQMPNGHGPVFAVHLKTPELAKRFPSLLHLFQHATSLGGVESLVEWRAMSDETVDRRLIRFSIGVEDARDLIEDVRQALHKLKAFV